jgi:hypothetical protein
MMGKQLALALDELGEMLFQHRRCASVQIPAARRQSERMRERSPRRRRRCSPTSDRQIG